MKKQALILMIVAAVFLIGCGSKNKKETAIIYKEINQQINVGNCTLTLESLAYDDKTYYGYAKILIHRNDSEKVSFSPESAQKVNGARTFFDGMQEYRFDIYSSTSTSSSLDAKYTEAGNDVYCDLTIDIRAESFDGKLYIIQDDKMILDEYDKINTDTFFTLEGTEMVDCFKSEDNVYNIKFSRLSIIVSSYAKSVDKDVTIVYEDGKKIDLSDKHYRISTVKTSENGLKKKTIRLKNIPSVENVKYIIVGENKCYLNQ